MEYALIAPVTMGIILMIWLILDFEIFIPRRVEKKIKKMKLKMLAERLVRQDRLRYYRKIKS